MNEIVKKEIMETSVQSQIPTNERGYTNAINDFNLEDYKFYIIKSTEHTKTGFPILPAALNSLINNEGSNSTKSICRIPLRILPDNCESILIPGIRTFLRRCYNDADKRRRSSRVCKHKPGVKHYCRRKNWDTILSKYKTEILDNPLIDLGSYCKINYLNLNKELLHQKQHVNQNKVEEPCILTKQKEHFPQHSEISKKIVDSRNKLSNNSISSYDGQSDSSSDYLGLIPSEEMDDMSSFLAIFGLKRKMPQKENVNCDDAKLVTAEISNNDEEKISTISDKILGGTDKDCSTIGGKETTNSKLCSEMNSVSSNLILEAENTSLMQREIQRVCTSSIETLEYSQNEKYDTNMHTVDKLEDTSTNPDQYDGIHINNNSIQGDRREEISSNHLVNSSSQECLCQNENSSCHGNIVNETCVSLHSPADVNSFLVENLLRNGTWSMPGCPQTHSSPRKCETRDIVPNSHEPDFSSVANRVASNIQGPFSAPLSSQTCTPRQMYSQTSGMNGVFPNFYGSPCVPTPVLASQIVPPILAYNFFPMNNVMCATQPGLMPFPSNGAFVSTAFDCTSQHSIHHSLPLPYHSQQGNPSLYHKPAFHQWVNVNASAVVPCWTQSTFVGGTHLPCCGGSSHSVEARSQLHYSSGFYPNEGYNAFSSHHSNSEVHMGNDLLNVSSRNADDLT